MSTVLYEVKGNIAILTISREKALNALNSEVLNDLNAALDAVDVNAVRALIITGAGKKSFVAGADIGEMSTLTPEEGEAFGKKGNDVFRKIETFPIPVIAAVNGFALGGGNIIAPGLAKEIIYSTKNIDAAKAKEVGLVNEVYTQDELLPAAEKLANKIAKNAPIAVRACKKAINEGLDLPMDEAIVVEEKLFGSCFKTHDQIEGMDAFLTKRKEKNFINA